MNNTNELTPAQIERKAKAEFPCGCMYYIVLFTFPMCFANPRFANFILIISAIIIAIIGISVICNLVTPTRGNYSPNSYYSAPTGSYQWYINRFFTIINSTQSGQEAYFGTLPMSELKNMHSAVNQWKKQGGWLNKHENEVFDWMADIIAGDSRLLFPSLTI